MFPLNSNWKMNVAIATNVMQVGEVYGLKRKIMLRREIREEYCKDNMIGAFNDLVLNDYALWLETQLHFAKSELSKLRQPTVISTVCFYPWHDSEVSTLGGCTKCKKYEEK